MFPLVSALTIVPVLFLGFLGLHSNGALLFGGFFLGIAGTVFAVGVPFVNAWYPPERRGLAVGIFGAGMAGTAISALSTLKLFTLHGEKSPFPITAVILAVFAVVSWLVLRDAPGRTAFGGTLLSRLTNAKLPITWQASILDAVAFGGYVAFSVYLPSYLKTAYDPPGRSPSEPDGRVRHDRGVDAPGRGLALGQVRRDPGARHRVRCRGSRCDGDRPVAATPAHRAGRLPRGGRGTRFGQRSDVRADRQGHDPTGSVG